MKVKYGREKLELPIQKKNVIKILNSKKQKVLSNPKNRLKELLKKPINSPSLKDLIIKKKSKRILIIVNDITRPTPYDIILPPLLQELQQIGIKKEDIIFIIATGSHRSNSDNEIEKVFGENISSTYQFINHSCDDTHSINFGKLKSGNTLLVNRIVSKVDFIITTGVIIPHYIAGYSGGRKSILPGICGRDTIENNHSFMLHPNAKAGNLIDNPVHDEMQEAAEKVGVDFNINVVTDENHQIIQIVAGDLQASWLKGVEVSEQTYFCPIKRRAELVIAGTGGYPKDINVYQAQKALENAYQAVKPGGTIVLLAECAEGYGQSTFEKWIDEANNPEDIIYRLKKKFILGGHKAYAIAKVAKEVEVILISSLPRDKVFKLFFLPMQDIDHALNYIKKKHGKNYQCYILPSGNTVFPKLV